MQGLFQFFSESWRVDDDDVRLLNSSEIPAAAQEDSVIETIIEYSDDDLAVVSDEDDPRLDEYF